MGDKRVDGKQVENIPGDRKRMPKSKETVQSHSYKTKDPSSCSVDACLTNVSEHVLFSQNSEGGRFYRQVRTQTRTKKAISSLNCITNHPQI